MKKILALLILLTLVVSVFAACKKDEKPADDNQPPVTDTPIVEQGPTLEDAKVVVRDLYKQIEITPDDFNVVASVLVDGVKFTITWATNSTDVVIAESTKENSYLVDIVPAEPEAAIPYVLTATIAAADGSTITTTFNFTVPKFQVNTYAEYVAAEADAPLVVEGVVYGIMSKAAGDKENSVFVQDLNGGGYYVYGLTDDPSETGVQVGQTVRVRGIKAIYNGTLEIKNASIEIRSTELTTVTPTDLTAAFTAASTAANANLLAHLGEYVIIKGVTVLEAGSNGYYYFELDGIKTYLRISSSSNCTTAEQETTIIGNHAAKFYYTADVAGIASIYQGNFYIMPVDANAFSNFSAEMQPLPDDVKANMVKDALTLPAEFVLANPYTLPATGAGDNFSDVAIAWALAETTNATLVEGVLTPVLPESGSVNIVLTATITKNNASVTKEFTIAVKKLEITSITAATELAAAQAHDTYTADKYMVEGVVKEIKSTSYGNMYITDAEGNELYVYGVYTSDGVTKYGDMTGDKPKVGDKVVLYGVLGTYNTDQQMKNAWLISWEHVTETITVNATCKADGYIRVVCNCGDVISEQVLPMGEHNYVNEVCSACGLKNHEHTTVADEVVAPTCTDDGYTVYSCSDENCTYTENKDVTTKLGHSYTDGVCTREGCHGSDISAAIAAADGTAVVVKGTVTEVNGAWSTQYNNMNVTITDSEGNTLYIYRLSTRVVLGEVITVSGNMATYNNARQIAQGATAEINVKHDCEYNAATCTEAELCKHCGAAKAGSEALGHTWGETGVTTAPTCTAVGYDTYTCSVCSATEKRNEVAALGHNYVEGVCDREGCGVNEPTGNEPVAQTYVLKTIASDGTAYYWDGSASSGKGGLTSDASKAVTLYMEETTGGVYVYYFNTAGAKVYLACNGSSNTAFKTSTTAAVMQYDSTNGYLYFVDGSDNRYVAAYGVQDIRTYKASNIPGSAKNTYFVLTIIE